jgi:DNA-binding CsgD family transcriptional regulator/tetratricopeptide (TPR) repeat protein
MLETIRDFAREQLAASGEEELIRERHAAYFGVFAAQYELAGFLPEPSEILALLEAEHANLRVTLAWLASRDDAQAFLRVAAALGHFWVEQGHYHEGRGWLERALAHPGATAMVDRATALEALGMIEAFQGATRAAVMHLTEGLAACRDQDAAFTAANALIGLGALAIAQGDHERGTALLEECVAVSRTVPDQRLAGIMAGWAWGNLAVISRADGDYALATERLEAALRVARDAGYTTGTIVVLGDLGDLARDQGHHERAMAFYREALVLGQDNPHMRVVGDVIEAVGILATTMGAVEHGARLLGAAEALRERIGLRFRVQETEVALARAIAAGRANLGEQRFATMWSAGRSFTPGQVVKAALDPFMTPSSTGGVSLTRRETEILRLLAAGMTDPAIAQALFISVRTVENHVARIFAKLGVRTRTAAATTAIATGLIATTPPAPA